MMHHGWSEKPLLYHADPDIEKLQETQKTATGFLISENPQDLLCRNRDRWREREREREEAAGMEHWRGGKMVGERCWPKLKVWCDETGLAW